MSTIALSGNEQNLQTIVNAIRDLQQGRMNAHGTATATGAGVAPSTAVPAGTCSELSQVTLTATSGAAATLMADGVWATAANGSFTIFHPTTAAPDATFTWSING